MTFSINNTAADVHCVLTGDDVVVQHGADSALLTLQVPGRHNLSNALAAVTALLAVDLRLGDIVAALNHFTNISGRLSARILSNGARIFDDSYNANPTSVRAGIDVLC
jgi:UDP-N-acetylmuramoyl-tripeptide--D-alanyl-D-alanine ligase